MKSSLKLMFIKIMNKSLKMMLFSKTLEVFSKMYIDVY